jgi:nitroreductase
MDFLEVVNKRKSVRKYLPDKKIPPEDVQKILETISLAPSARNLQSYKVFVVQKSDVIDKVSKACYSQKEDFIRNAAAILIFCTDPDKTTECFGERGKSLFTFQDATIAATYAILTAASFGYASCWVGNFNEEEMKKVLKTELRPVTAIVIGYSDEESERKQRKPLDTIAEFI